MTDLFSPKYTITNRLLANIKRINILITNLNRRRFPKIVLYQLEKTAREISSHASTSIEGNPLPLTEVKRILKSRPDYIRNSEKEVLNYNEALMQLNKSNKEKFISLELILNIHKTVMKDLLPQKQDIGTIRKRPVIVNNPKTGQIIYLPPDADAVKTLILSLIEFVNKRSKEIDPIILSGIFHKQMVLIHPFIDGNGRTTRLATKVLLAKMGLNTFNLFSFENYYNNNVSRYFQFIGEKGDYYEIKDKINFTGWLEYFSEGIIDELVRVQKNMPDIATFPLNQIQPHQQKIVNFIRQKGFIKDRDYAKLVKRARSTRAVDFNKLISLGIIIRKNKGKATYYTFPE